MVHILRVEGSTHLEVGDCCTDFQEGCTVQTIGTCATSEVILIVPPTGDYTNVTTHVKPRHTQCKPQGNIKKEKE